MRTLFVTLLSICTSLSSLAQTNTQRLIDLEKAYNDFMFRNDPKKDNLKPLKSNVPDNLKTTTSFLIQTLTRDNDLLTKAIACRRPKHRCMSWSIFPKIDGLPYYQFNARTTCYWVPS